MRYLFIFFFLLIFAPAYSQKNMTAKKYKKLGRDSLLKIATDYIRKNLDTCFNPADYKVQRVTKREDMLYVSFIMPIQFVPAKGSYTYNVSVTLPDFSMSYSLLSCNGESSTDPHFFKHTEETRKAVDFIFASINNSNEVGHVKEEEWPSNSVMVIKDMGAYYDIEVDDDYIHSYYKIKKDSGEIYDAGHKHYAIDPDDRKKIEIIE